MKDICHRCKVPTGLRDVTVNKAITFTQRHISVSFPYRLQPVLLSTEFALNRTGFNRVGPLLFGPRIASSHVSHPAPAACSLVLPIPPAEAAMQSSQMTPQHILATRSELFGLYVNS